MSLEVTNSLCFEKCSECFLEFLSKGWATGTFIIQSCPSLVEDCPSPSTWGTTFAHISRLCLPTGWVDHWKSWDGEKMEKWANACLKCHSVNMKGIFPVQSTKAMTRSGLRSYDLVPATLIFCILRNLPSFLKLITFVCRILQLLPVPSCVIAVSIL